MKSVQYTIAIMLLASTMCLSCKDGKTTADAAENDSIAESASSEINYLSADLAFFGLKGQVKTVTELQKLLGEYGEGVDPEITVYEFDEQGTLLTINDADPFAKAIDEDSGIASWWERDSKGNISATDVFTMSLDQEPIAGNRFKWADGRVKSETQTSFFEGPIVAELTYQYDKNGNLVSKDGTMSAQGMDNHPVHHKYEYKDFDKNGNWTSCTETTDDTGESGEDEFQYHTARTITYFIK